MSKIFGTDGIRCLVNEEPLSAETCLKISKTVAFLLKKKNSKNSRVVICKDTRLSGYLYEPLVTAGFISMGMDVILVGPLPTPAVPLMIKTLRADIGVMITASHNTYEYNGLKFFDSTGTKLSSSIEQKVENIVLNNKETSANIIDENSSNKIVKSNQVETKDLLESNIVKETSNSSKTSAIANERTPKEEMVLKSSGNSWVEIEDLDGNSYLTRLMRSGETFVVPNVKGLTLSTGNAGVLSLTFGSTHISKLGSVGEVISSRPLNIEAFKKR